MPGSARILVGRDREIRELDVALEEACEGHGCLLLIQGEAGIGKSRLVEEAARRAATRGFGVFWGRCWEAGGAPAFWPWIQVCRGLLRFRDRRALGERLGTRVGRLAQLLPELRGEPAEGEPPSMRPEQARFQLLDVVATVLSDAAAEQPLLLILEDLHTADPSSLELLEFVAQQIQGVRMVVLGTCRDAEVAAMPMAELFGRIGRQGRRLVLARLTRDDVEQLVANEWPDVPRGPLSNAVHAMTEGNPLFVGEVLQLIAQRHDALRVASTGEFVLPRGVQAVLAERLATLESGTRDVIARAAIIGREFSEPILQHAFGLAPSDLARALDDAETGGVVHRVTRTDCRFSHVLYRDALYEALSETQRRERHAAVAAYLARSGAADADTSWAEIAHHCDRAGPRAPMDPAVALKRAAETALASFAFGDAALHYRRALDLLRQQERETERLVDELLLGLGEACSTAGDLDAGRAACEEAAERARGRGDAGLLARAALQYGSVFLFADVDDRLVALLSEALEALGESDPGLTALVMSRLAAAKQPSDRPESLFVMARRAVAIAREVGDPRVLLGTMRSACSALADLADPEERARLNREYVELARSLGEASEVLRGEFRLIFDHVELGRIAEIERSMDAADRLAEDLAHPLFQWRVAAFRTALAMWQGRFEEAERFRAHAEELAQRSRDPTAPRALLLQWAEMLVVRGDLEAAQAWIPKIRQAVAGSGAAWAFGALYACSCLTRAGRLAEARAILTPELVSKALSLRDGSVYDALSIIAAALDDRDLAGRVQRSWGQSPAPFVSGGMTAMWFGAPTSRPIARLAAIQGDTERALALFERADEEARAVGAVPQRVWIALEYADLVLERGDTGRHLGRAREHLDLAATLVATLGAPRLEQRVHQLHGRIAELGVPGAGGGRTLPDAAAGSASEAAARPERTLRTTGPVPFSLDRQGEYWTVRVGEAEFRLKDTKGLQIVDRLVREPEREFHVLDLSGTSGFRDGGDAGELLDEQARDAYRSRIIELRQQIEQATEWNDSARAETAQQELEAVSRELSRAVGLGDRPRRASSAVERARVNVQRRIRDAIRRVERESPELARHLDRSIRTGAYCVYCPE